MKTKIHYILKHVKDYIDHILNKNGDLCQIVEIDILRRSIVIHCRGINAPIKLSFDELINDYAMLSNLSSKHAAWVGYFYGKHYNNLINSKHPCITKFDFSMGDPTGKFNILMLNRKGELIYTDKNSDKNYVISPMNALTDEIIITSFDAIQACYIGILAGTRSKNIITKTSTNSKNTHLRLIE